MSNIPTNPGLTIEELAWAIERAHSRANDSGLDDMLVEVQIRSGEYEGSDVYLEVADVLLSEQTGRLVLLAGKRIERVQR